MAGHSKWANIRHRKERQDSKRSKIWSKCSKALMAAARAGGPDPDTNLTLRYAIDEAKYANMPKDTIKRAIDKGAGSGQGDSYESITYEGYGPGGTAIIIDTLTDNKNRTVTEIRTLFKKGGGSLGNAGTVAYMFQTKGQILVDAAKVSEEQIMDLAIEAGAEDVQAPEADDDDAGFWTIITEATGFQQVKVAIEEAGIEITEAQIAKIPDDTVAVAGEDAKKVVNLIEGIEDNDDVQSVYTNADIDAASLAD
ncbi:MAG: YebC/PmpR family DNA-binding transcriptional regulator [Phycisphaera sp.]|nr:MAG: YebC/PmpR family DNA-binding transcriptional regulator [Phycisphaera sp.]